ncbi:MAG TPA: ABC transporter ATP-binding protein/permease [Candidatus Eisenbergiella merdipullorum]|uniref:ABC transporter ATP-binding protein/permease n=1 Tax=Candidatus Eisenbergiella merdipullorum TaxID=2838553 RepID=A0A9D2KZL3_9FIRM|nr:ABC transporter ATP-binding protein/permease [Candidatus Eisenbergiella merdipullorum]
MKKEALGKVVFRTWKTVWKAAPFSAGLAQVYYLLEGSFPAFFTVVTAIFFDRAYACVEAQGNFRSLYMPGAALAAGYFVRYLLQYLSSMAINAGVYEKNTCFQKMLVGGKNARLPLQMLEDPSVLDMQKRALESVDREILSSLYMTSSVFLTNVIGVVSILTVLYGYSGILVLISVLSVVPFLFIRLLRGKEFYTMKTKQTGEQRKTDYYWSLLTEKDSVKELKLLNAMAFVREKWNASRKKIERETQTQKKKETFSMLFCDFLRILGYGASIGLVVWYVMRGRLGIGISGACLTAFLSMQDQTRNFLTELGRMSEYAAYAQDYFSYMDLPEEEVKEEKKDTAPSFDSLIVKNLSFRYPSSPKKALQDISFQIGRKEKVVIVGENGCGKTTLVKLLLGFYTPEEGEIVWNGKNSTNVSMVLQDFTRYEMSIRENVTISDIARQKDDAGIKKALTDVGLKTYAGEDRLDEVIGRKFGTLTLSGGQWQRLAIARGIFRKHEIIFLDEPTSALDPYAEYEILQQFLRMIRDRTAVIVSHRVGLCRFADKIIMMQNGTIAEVGSHEELMKKKGLYFRYYSEQAKWCH